MPEDAKSGQTKAGYIPKPPTKADVDAVSQEQGMISDEWGDAAPHQPDTSPTPGKPVP